MSASAELSGLTVSLVIDSVAVIGRGKPRTLQAGQALELRVRWTVSGTALGILGGVWRVSAWLTEGDSRLQLNEVTTPVVPTVAGSIAHAMVLRVPAGAIPQSGEDQRISVEVTHHNRGEPSWLMCELECEPNRE